MIEDATSANALRCILRSSDSFEVNGRLPTSPRNFLVQIGLPLKLDSKVMKKGIK